MNGFFDYVKNNTDQIGDLLLEHLQLTVFAVVIAVVLGIPIGILITSDHHGRALFTLADRQKYVHRSIEYSGRYA